ncbi:MAG: XdhC family protein [Desulfitobacterium hafniense]|nr:XdhC family protein [Desulfitobacterium hafniense]
MDSKLITALNSICKDDKAAALVTITGVKGSTPRKPGAKMIVLPDGQVFGTIGGGCGEAEVRQQALAALDQLRAVKYTVNMTNDMAEEEGMICGGIMEVFIDIINPGPNQERELLAGYLVSLEAGEEPLLVTVISSPLESGHLGRKIVITTDGKGFGDLGKTELNRLAGEWAEQVRSEGKTRTISSTIDEGQAEWQLLFEPAPAPVELLILGGGHIALPLATMANILGYRITVVDDRPAFANSTRFPGVSQVICKDFVRALQEIPINPKTFVVIVTRGHRHDKLCLREVAARPTAYVGMIGSRRRVKALLSELLEEGFSPESLNRIYSPIGLDIAAESPEEIAVGILAEIIKVHRGGKAQSLKLSNN